MIKTAMTPASDMDLVSQSLSGDRAAFEHIVSRYQNFICAVAYSATGNFAASEDLAQETFVTAWKQLANLREREKLRAWLCGIARNLIHNSLRKQGREPSHRAESLDEISEFAAPEPLPVERTISNEEAEILWRSLERIPEIYREPLVLFYREHQSIEAVAQNLELSEDAVKQRLSRGRKLLHEQVLVLIETALERTSPGKVFTLEVMAALPALTMSTKAAVLGAAAKGSATAKVAGVFGLILAPLLALSGFYANYRLLRDQVHSDRERRKIKALFIISLLAAVVFGAFVLTRLFFAVRSGNHTSILFWSLLFSQVVVVYFLALLVQALLSLRARRRSLAGILAAEHGGHFPPAAFEYRSRMSLCGLPLVHVRIGDRFGLLRGPVKAWIAVGGHAVGVLFASGGLAIAPVSIGAVAIGLFSLGAISTGIFPIGPISLGACAYGGLAIGWQSFGPCAIAGHAAAGGIAIARDFAEGSIAHAAQANTASAAQFFQQSWYFRWAQMLYRHGFWVTPFWVIPLLVQARIVGKARRRREQENSRPANFLNKI